MLPPPGQPRRTWDSEGVVRKKRRADGTIAVQLSWMSVWEHTAVHLGPIICIPIKLRSGGPRLKGTQSYPPGFCRRIAQLHRTRVTAARLHCAAARKLETQHATTAHLYMCYLRMPTMCPPSHVLMTSSKPRCLA